jgi:hypothetical protein
MSQTLMVNVDEDNCQIDADGSIASTSTFSCHNSKVCLVSFLKEKGKIIGSSTIDN